MSVILRYVAHIYIYINTQYIIPLYIYTVSIYIYVYSLPQKCWHLGHLWKPSYIAVLQTQQILGCYLWKKSHGRLPPNGAGRKSSTQTVPLKGWYVKFPGYWGELPDSMGSMKNGRDIWKRTTIGDTSGGKVDPDPSKLRLLKPLNSIFPNLWWDLDLQNQTTTMPSSLFVHPETIPISRSGHSRKNCLRKLRSICFQGTTLRIKVKGLRCQKQHLDRYHPQLLLIDMLPLRGPEGPGFTYDLEVFSTPQDCCVNWGSIHLTCEAYVGEWIHWRALYKLT